MSANYPNTVFTTVSILYVHVCMYVEYVGMYVCICMNVCMYICACKLVCMYVCMYLDASTDRVRHLNCNMSIFISRDLKHCPINMKI